MQTEKEIMIDTIKHFSEIALAISEACGLDVVCSALESGRLSKDSTSAMRASISSGNKSIEVLLPSLQKVWVRLDENLTGQTIALILRTCVTSAILLHLQKQTAQVVWTGPKVNGSFLRDTREVMREILRQTKEELLVVGYWITVQDNKERLIEDFISSLSDAVKRKVKVKLIFDERVRPNGYDNRSILLSVWPVGIPLPKILTWHLPKDDKYIKLHAKVLVSDRHDALVTSANLTSYAMEKNMEMGIRICGQPSVDIVKHFELLEANGIVEPYKEE